MKALVVIPTYNERDNVQALLPELLKRYEGIHLLVVDDSSPDGTGEEVLRLSQGQPRIHLLNRAKKEGLGRAYIAGFNWGIDQGFDCMIEMDADFSHRPQDLGLILEQLKSGSDFVIGSRYVPGGSTVNWGWFRKLISRGGSLYARLILGYPLRDWTGGFNGWTRKALAAIHLPSVQSNGYSFQIELKYRALKAGCQGIEVPITFEERRVGQSKMSTAIVLEAFRRVWFFRFGR